MQHFSELIKASWWRQNSFLCVGLDPDIAKMPGAIRASKTPLFDFGREIIDATCDYVCAFKPQIAYYSAVGAEKELEKTCLYIKEKYPHLPIILDAKRGDIKATAAMYAREIFTRYQADAVTVNPFMGGDSLQPFLEFSDGKKGVFILCRTSNPGGCELQDLQIGDESLAQIIAGRAANEWNVNNNIGLVVGATNPNEIKKLRAAAATLPFLIPGIGAQGGDLVAAVSAGKRSDASGIIINISRAIIYANDTNKNQKDFATAAATAAENFCKQINEI